MQICFSFQQNDRDMLPIRIRTELYFFYLVLKHFPKKIRSEKLDSNIMTPSQVHNL